MIPYQPERRFTALLLYFWESGAIVDIYEECGVLKVGDDVTPRDPKGEGGYEYIKT